jgi:UTP-glucose-1-phosphate uridylyltransferase
MAAPLNTCTTIEQHGVVRFLWAKNMVAAKDIHKEMLPIWARPFVRGINNLLKLGVCASRNQVVAIRARQELEYL